MSVEMTVHCPTMCLRPPVVSLGRKSHTLVVCTVCNFLRTEGRCICNNTVYFIAVYMHVSIQVPTPLKPVYNSGVP